MGRVSWQQLETGAGVPAAADVLDGFQTFAAAGGPTTVITVPQGRTWVGTITAECTVSVSAATVTQGSATLTVTTAGAGVIPAAGTWLRCDTFAGVNAAGGTAGTQGTGYNSTPFTVVAPAGNAVTVQATFASTGTLSQGSVSAIGALV